MQAQLDLTQSPTRHLAALVLEGLQFLRGEGLAYSHDHRTQTLTKGDLGCRQRRLSRTVLRQALQQQFHVELAVVVGEALSARVQGRVGGRRSAFISMRSV